VAADETLEAKFEDDPENGRARSLTRNSGSPQSAGEFAGPCRWPCWVRPEVGPARRLFARLELGGAQRLAEIGHSQVRVYRLQARLWTTTGWSSLSAASANHAVELPNGLSLANEALTNL